MFTKNNLNINDLLKFVLLGMIIQSIGLLIHAHGPEKYLWHLLGNDLIFWGFSLVNIVLCFFATRYLSLSKLLIFCFALSISFFLIDNIIGIFIPTLVSPKNFEVQHMKWFFGIIIFMCYFLTSMFFHLINSLVNYFSRK